MNYCLAEKEQEIPKGNKNDPVSVSLWDKIDSSEKDQDKACEWK